MFYSKIFSSSFKGRCFSHQLEPVSHKLHRNNFISRNILMLLFCPERCLKKCSFSHLAVHSVELDFVAITAFHI